MRILFIITTLFFLSCSEKKTAKTESETIAEKPQAEEKEVKKKIKEVFEVEKLTNEEKLKLLIGNPQNNRDTSFQEVINFLDPYGETFAYMNFHEIKEKYTEKAIKLWEFIASNTEIESDSIKEFNNFKEFVRSLGIMDIDAIGLSHYRTDEGLIKNKLAIHKRPSGSQSLYWHCFGKNESFDCLDFLPGQTVFASGFRVNLEIVCELNNLYIEKFKPIGEALKKLQNKITLFKSLNEVFTGEVNITVFWDHENQELNEKTKDFVSMALIVKVKEDADLKKVTSVNWRKYAELFDIIDQNTDFTFIRKDQYVVITDKKGNDFLNSGKLLKDKEEFKKKLKYIQPVGSMYNYLSPVITEKAYNSIIEAIPGGIFNEGFQILVTKEDISYHFLNVMENRPEGFYYSGISNGGSYLFFMVNYISTIFHHIIFFNEAQSTEKLSEFFDKTDFDSISGMLRGAANSLSNIKPKTATNSKPKGSIEETKKDLAVIQYALNEYRKKNNGFYPSPDGAEGLQMLAEKKLIKNAATFLSSLDSKRTKADSLIFSEYEVSYLYLGANVTKDSAGYYYPLVISKPGVLDKGFLAILANGKTAHFKSGGESISSILYTLNKSYRYNERQKHILREKFKKFSDQ